MIKTIVFDIGRVLVEFEWKDYLNSLFDEETAKAVNAAMWETGYWHELDRAVLTVDEIVDLFYQAGSEYREQIDKAFGNVGSCVVRRDWAIPMIEDLKARGYRVLYLSNYSEYVMSTNREALDFLTHMDGGIFSCYVNVIKPDPEIFRILFREYDLVPEECLFIDDSAANVEKAHELGMHAILFTSYERLCEDLEAELAC